jgi:hypothetical protein
MFLLRVNNKNKEFLNMKKILRTVIAMALVASCLGNSTLSAEAMSVPSGSLKETHTYQWKPECFREALPYFGGYADLSPHYGDVSAITYNLPDGDYYVSNYQEDISLNNYEITEDVIIKVFCTDDYDVSVEKYNTKFLTVTEVDPVIQSNNSDVRVYKIEKEYFNSHSGITLEFNLKNENTKFKSIDESTTLPSYTVTCGDIKSVKSPVVEEDHTQSKRLMCDLNKDGRVNSGDLLLMRRYILGLSNEVNPLLGDLTGDGLLLVNDLAFMTKMLTNPNSEFNTYITVDEYNYYITGVTDC